MIRTIHIWREQFSSLSCQFLVRILRIHSLNSLIIVTCRRNISILDTLDAQILSQHMELVIINIRESYCSWVIQVRIFTMNECKFIYQIQWFYNNRTCFRKWQRDKTLASWLFWSRYCTGANNHGSGKRNLMLGSIIFIAEYIC